MELKRRCLFFCLILFLSFHAPLFSQTETPSEWEDVTEQLSLDNEEEEKDWTNNLEDLAYLKDNPLNLNRITKEQLEQFPFLTDLQIEHLLYYLYVSGPIKTVYELQMVEDFDRQTIQYLLPFVYVGEVEKKSILPHWKDIWKYGKHELITRIDIPLYRKEGYRQHSDSLLTADVNKQFIGSSYYNSLRYGFHYKDLLYCGITAEKDAGEPFFRSVNKYGYDYYSFYFLAHNLGKLKTLALGNYRMSFGQGLVLSSDYTLGKSSAIATMGYKSTGIKKHSSTDEYNFFQGAAATYKDKDFTFTGFYSYRNLDGIVTDGVLTSIKRDGMHRIPRDVERKNVASIQLMGGNVGYSFHNLKMGFTGIYYFFDKNYMPQSQPYNYYNLRGKEFYNLSLDYKYRWNKVYFFGETAAGNSGGLATLNTISFSPAAGYQLLFLQRYYAKDYRALYARSVSEGSSVQNENGCYLGIEAKPIRFWKLFAYADFFHFPWLRYGVDKPSSGFDGLVQATYMPTTNLTMLFRYRYKSKDKNYTPEGSDVKAVLPYIQQKVRYQIGYLLQNNLSLKVTADWVWANPEGIKAKHGYMFLNNFSYKFQNLPLSFDVYYGMFDTNDYSARISSYERGMLYAFSMPSFYGKGVRFAINSRYDFNRNLMIMAKFGQTRYTDRNAIGSGLETIYDDTKADVNFQLRWKF